MCQGWCTLAARSGLSARLKTVSRPRPQLWSGGWTQCTMENEVGLKKIIIHISFDRAHRRIQDLFKQVNDKFESVFHCSVLFFFVFIICPMLNVWQLTQVRTQGAACHQSPHSNCQHSQTTYTSSSQRERKRCNQQLPVQEIFDC